MPDRLSHYVLLERLGTGGMGTVYRARDDVSGADVAVKVLHPYLAHDAEYVRRFEREARIAQSIDAPEVVKVLGSGREDETYFLVMELVPGETLAEVIQKRGRLPVDEAVGIATSVARAMAAAHARGIVHRDISPQNVMITPAGEAKVMDFGVSRDLTQATMTATSLLMGKPYYIAPELVTSASRPDIRSDIYALGVMLFQMLAGDVPFTAPTPYAVMQKHVTEAPPEVDTLRPETPAWLVEVVARCLVKEPSARFQTPEALLQALDTDEQTVRIPRVRVATLDQTERMVRPQFQSGRTISNIIKHESAKSRQRALVPTIGSFVALVVIGVALIIVALASVSGGKSGNQSDGTGGNLQAGLKTDQPTPEATIDLINRAPSTTLIDNNLTGIGRGDKIVISKFGVNAPLTYRVVGPDGQMPNPDGPDDIAYYNFSAWPGKGGAPGKGGNAVFAGHVDSGAKACKNGTVPPPCQAVLWDLTGLRVGDEIEVVVGGQSFKYAVATNQPVPASTGPWDTIVSATRTESITLITTGGDFNRVTREYTNRQVVTAIRKS